MRKLVIVLLLVLISSLSAQLNWEKSIPVRQSVNIEWGRSSATIPDGSVVYVWSDVRRGDRDIYAQKVDGDGNMLWGENSTNSNFPGMKEGIMINGAEDRQEDIVIIETGDSQTIVAWVDFRNDPLDGDIYAQKLDADGNILWAEDGVPICLADDVQISLNIASDENGGAYVIWLDSRFQTGPDIFGTHITADGTLADGWVEDGNSIITAVGVQGQHTFWEDGANGAVVAWADNRDSGNPNIYMQRIAPNGDLLWDTDGSLLVDFAGEQVKPKITRTADDKFFFTWRDKRSDSNGDIYAQLVDIDGNHLWANEIIVKDGVGKQRNPRIQNTSDNSAVVVWEDGTEEINFNNLMGQKINQAGELIWDTDGVVISAAIYDQLNPRTASDGDGGVWFIWDDARDGDYPNIDIFVQHVNNSGVVQLEADGQRVCSQFSEQFSPLIKHNGDKVFTVWGNGNNETGARTIQVQILSEDGVELLPENGNVLYGGISGNAANYLFLENGANPVVVWEDSRFSHIANQNYLQILHPDETYGFEPNGISITEMTGTNQEELNASLSDDNTKIASAWTEGRVDGIAYTYTQLMDLDGNRLWGEQGLEICDNDVAQDNPKIANHNGDYYVAWSDSRENWDFGIYMQKLNEAGELQWATEGVEISDLPGDDLLMAIVDNYVIWKNYVSFNDINIHVAKIDEDGAPAAGWPAGGISVCSATGKQENAQAIMTDEGLLIIWQDQRSGTSDIYGQIIADDGSLVWELDGAPLVITPNDQVSSNPLYNNGLFLAWDDLNSGDYDVYMQSFNATAAENWTTGGVDIMTETNNQQVPCITSNGDSFLVCWESYFGSGEAGVVESNINAQLVDAAGVKQWDLIAGKPLTTAIKDQKKPVAAYAGNNSSYIIWEDARSSGKNDIYNIYAQNVEYELLGSDDSELTLYRALKQNYPNPFNPTTTIKFSIDANSENTELAIYNIKGQKVKTLLNSNLTAGLHSVVWDGKDNNNQKVSSGVYFYKLSSDNVVETRKMVLMK